MIKTKKNVDYSGVTPALVDLVKDVIAEGDRHSYTVSKVYAAYNAAFGLRDTPQTCGTCLQKRVRLLAAWLDGLGDYAREQILKREEELRNETPTAGNEGGDVNTGPQYDDPGAPGYVPQVEGTVRYPMSEGIPFDFLPYEGTIVKGTVTRADGSKIRPGMYHTAEGLEIVIQPGGKAVIREVVEDLT